MTTTSDIIHIIVSDLSHPGNTFEGKDLLIAKLEYVVSFQDAYLDDTEKQEINRILKKHRIPHRIS